MHGFMLQIMYTTVFRVMNITFILHVLEITLYFYTTCTRNNFMVHFFYLKKFMIIIKSCKILSLSHLDDDNNINYIKIWTVAVSVSSITFFSPEDKYLLKK